MSKMLKSSGAMAVARLVHALKGHGQASELMPTHDDIEIAAIAA